MDDLTRERLKERNNKIIEKVLNEINTKYPNTVDMIAIAGSFASGQYYEKSDLDLLIIENDEIVENISKCFIYEDVGQDVYVSKWENLESMANYNNHFVTKLKDLIFVYVKDEKVIDKYKELQKKLNYNMNDIESINKKIGKYLATAIKTQESIKENYDMKENYKSLGSIMNIIEIIIYMMNKKYVVGGTKCIPQEIEKMEILPTDFLDKYYKLLDCVSKKDIENSTKEILNCLINYFNENNIEIINDETKKEKENIDKKIPTKNDFTDTYEELYSNYYNKLKHASDTNNKYLSFRTMVDIQKFLDEFNDEYNIPNFSLLEKYNPNDLKSNFIEYENCLKDWLKLYEKFDIKVNIIKSLDELYESNDKALTKK